MKVKKWRERTTVEKILTVAVIVLAVVLIAVIARAETVAEKMFDENAYPLAVLNCKEKKTNTDIVIYVKQRIVGVDELIFQYDAKKIADEKQLEIDCPGSVITITPK